MYISSHHFCHRYSSCNESLISPCSSLATASPGCEKRCQFKQGMIFGMYCCAKSLQRRDENRHRRREPRLSAPG